MPGNVRRLARAGLFLLAGGVLGSAVLAAEARPVAETGPAPVSGPDTGSSGAIDWAPLVSRDTDISGHARRRMLGPFFESREGTNGQSLWAIPPLASTIRDPSDQRSETDALWPLLVSRRHRNLWQMRMAVLGLWRDYDTQDPHSQYALWFLPVYFQGRDPEHRPYFAIFPVGGKISQILLWDQVWFALFPLYGHAEIGEVKTDTTLWPLFMHTRAPDIRRDSWFPFYGRSRRDHDFDKRYVLWPFWTSARYAYQKSHGFSWILFPLVGHYHLSDQEAWLFLPPFTRFSRSQQLTQVNCPWPIFQYSSGLIEKLYFWPVVGYKVIGDTQTGFLFWPLGLQARRVTPQGVNQRYYLVPILYSETQTARGRPGAQAAGKADEPDVTLRHFKVWPLFTYRRVGAQSRFGFPSLCPYKDYEVIERNYGPLWTLYSHSSCGEVREDELLWGWIQWRRSSSGLLKTSLFPLFSVERPRSGAGVEWSLLKGLIGRERDGEQMRTRLLYVIRW